MEKVTRLIFHKIPIANNYPKYLVINKDKEVIGEIMYERTGRFMHWCNTVHRYMFEHCDYISLSPGCQDEIREFCRELGGKKKSYNAKERQ